MQQLLSTHRDEDNKPLLAMLDDNGQVVHMLSSDNSQEVFSITYSDYLAIKQWLGL